MTFNPQLIWFLIGLGLILSEFLAPGIILVFFGLGAWTAAAASIIGIAPGWTSQLLVFTISSVVYLLLLRKWFQNKFIGFEGDPQNPETNLDDFSGQLVLVTVSIDPAHNDGRVEFKGAIWSARSPEPIAAGVRAKVVGVDSITLLVEPV